MKFRLAMSAILAITFSFAQAQDVPPAASVEPDIAPNPTAPPTSDPAEVVTLQPKAEKPRGDVITLKSGQVVEGLQILRENSAFYVLEITNSVTLDIPRRQVVSVEYDNIEPGMEQPQPTLIRGQRLSDQLEAVLDTDISDPPFDYNKADLIQVLSDVAGRVNGSLVLDPSIKETMPPATRAWTVRSEPGMTLGTLLRKELMEDFPDLAIVFKDDQVVLTTEEAAVAPTTPGEATPSAGTAPSTDVTSSTASPATSQSP